MSQKPTLVLVPGSGHTAETWTKIVSLMEAQHYKCVPLTLPSSSSNIAAGLYDDIQAVRNAILSETTQGRNVVIVVHSYGGAVGQSAIKGLPRPKGAPSPPTKDGHVTGMIMMASGFVTGQVSFLEGLGGKPPPSWKADTESGLAVLTVDPRELFYHDLPEEEGRYWVGRLEKQSLKALTEGGEHAYAGWKDVPVWYLVTTEDKALPPSAQKMMVQMAREGGGDVTVREVASSHSPMLSKPQETADFIFDALASFGGC